MTVIVELPMKSLIEHIWTSAAGDNVETYLRWIIKSLQNK